MRTLNSDAPRSKRLERREKRESRTSVKKHDPSSQPAFAERHHHACPAWAFGARRRAATLASADQRHSQFLRGGLSRPLRQRPDGRDAGIELPAPKCGEAFGSVPNGCQCRRRRRFAFPRRATIPIGRTERRPCRDGARDAGGARRSRFSADVAAPGDGRASRRLRPRLPRAVRGRAAGRRARHRVLARQRGFAFATLSGRADGGAPAIERRRERSRSGRGRRKRSGHTRRDGKREEVG